MNQSQWYLNGQDCPPQNFMTLICTLTGQEQCDYLAQLLWNRGIRENNQLEYWLNINSYQPTAYTEWGEEIKLAIQRINQARVEGETVVVWGKWQVGSIVSTCILDEGLKQFLSASNQLQYYFPSRCQSYFGLNCQGIEKLAKQGVSLIITADTGSYNLDTLDYARSLGIDIIIIDRCELMNKPSSVVAYLNPRYLPTNHSFYHFTAVAIAYKLIAGLGNEYPHYFTKSETNLLDLVALGLLTDTVNLQGDGRFSCLIKLIPSVAK